jgi:hypothetical protein
MTNFVLARTLTVLATAAVLAAGTLAGSASASAHGMGGMGGMGMGNHSVNLTQTSNLTKVIDHNLTNNLTKVVDHDSRRRLRFRFISIGSGEPVSTCFYKHTIWGWAKICPDLD